MTTPRLPRAPLPIDWFCWLNFLTRSCGLGPASPALRPPPPRGGQGWPAGLPQGPRTQGTVEGRAEQLWPWCIDRPLPREHAELPFGNSLHQSEGILQCTLALKSLGCRHKGTGWVGGELHVPPKSLSHHTCPASRLSAISGDDVAAGAGLYQLNYFLFNLFPSPPLQMGS